MLVFTPTVDDGAMARWRALRLDAKSALPVGDVVVLAARVPGGAANGTATRQFTALGGRVKPAPTRVLLVLPLPSDASAAPAIQVLEVGESAAQLLRDVRACFPSLVRKSPLADDLDDSDGSDSEGSPTAKKTQAAAAAAAPTPETAAFLAATRVRVLPSLAALREAYAFESDALALAVARDIDASATVTTAPPQFLCLEFPANAPPPTADAALNFGVVVTHARDAASRFLEIPLLREPRGVFSSGPGEDDGEHAVFQDATVFTVGAKRESTAHGGGKTAEEALLNIRQRHASGTFCTLVAPMRRWSEVVDAYGAALPPLRALRDGELRSRRFVGVAPNRAVAIVLEESR